MKTINLDEILNKDTFQFLEKPGLGKRKLYVKAAMKEAIRQALEIAAEDVKYTIRDYVDDHGFDQEEWRVDKKSILNVIERVK